MKKALQNLGFYRFYSLISAFWGDSSHSASLWISRFVATLLIISFVIPPALMPVFLYAGDTHDKTARDAGDTPREQQKPHEPANPDHGDVPPVLEVVPRERRGENVKKDDRKYIKEERPLQVMGGDSGIGKEVATIIPNAHRQFSVNSSDGSLSYKYEFSLPAGRGGLTPELSLEYSSNNTKNDSIVGYGWSFNIPSIERVNKRGSDNLYTSNDFTSSLGGELILVSTSTGAYISKTETGDFLAYTFANNKWAVYDKNGTIYFFGSTTQARQDDVASTTRVYKWMLEEVRDRNDNFIRYDYFKDSGQIYPEKIFYTGNGVTDGIFEVEFERNATTTSPTLYSTVFAVKNKYEISNIIIKENNQWVKKYDLVYGRGDAGFRSLLKNITEAGRDLLTSSVVEKESTFFSYKTREALGWEIVATSTDLWKLPRWIYDEDADESTMIQFADVNGDSYVDVLHYEHSNKDCDFKNTFINDTQGGWITYHGCEENWEVPILLANTDNVFSNYGTRVFDFNGDVLPDFIHSYGSPGTSTVQNIISVYKNDKINKNGWSQVSSAALPINLVFSSGVFADNGVQIVDINADGIQDVVYGWQDDDFDNPFLQETYIGDGYGNWSSTTDSSRWNLPYYVIDENEDGPEVFSHAQISDINHDGLYDMFFRWSTQNGSFQQTFVNNGNNWNTDDDIDFWYIPFVTQVKNSNDLTDPGLRASDINGDDITDYYVSTTNVFFPYAPSSISCSLYINTLNEDSNYNGNDGKSFIHIDNPVINCPEAFAGQGGVSRYPVMFDVNADGMDDILYSEIWYNEVITRTHLNKGTPFTDMLVGVETPEGATSSISYKMSSKYFDENDNLLNPQLPLLVKTVEHIKVNDGFGNISEENYIYASGTYYYNNPHDRKFAGFGRVEKTDVLGNVTKTHFHQGNYTATSTGEYNDHPSKIGKPYLIEQYDNAGNLFARTIHKWDHSDTLTAAGATSSFVKLAQTLEMTYDGDSDHKDKVQTFTYDNITGNISSKTEYGEVTGATDGTFSDTGSDLFTTSYTYATSTATSSPAQGFATSTLPARELVKNQAGATVSDTKMYYDAQAFGMLTKGNVTKQEMLSTTTKATPVYIDIEKTYDTYGLVIQEKDPRDKITTHTYDEYNMYPATTTNPLGHTTSFIYDYSAGKPTQVTDANGRIFQVVYDGLDRVTQEKQPDIASPSTLVTKRAYVYNDNTFPTSVVQVDELSSTLSVPTYTYFDGLGRPIQERRKAEVSNTYTVRDTAYDTRGMKAKESLPYFSTGSARTSALSGSSKLWNTFDYDAIGRIKTITNVVGTTTNTYDDWKLTITDARGKTKDLTKDARGNLVRVDEKNGTSTYTTLYEWNGLGNLTKITDALSNVRNFAYDNLGRRIRAEDLHAVSDTQFSSSTYAYDAAGNILTMIDGKGQTIQYTYDDINRVLSEDFTGQAGIEVAYQYDVCTNGKGALCYATTSDVVSEYVYDALGRPSSESRQIANQIHTTSYEYDKAGNQTLITTPDSAQVKYVYNDAGLVESIERKEATGSFVDVVEDLDYSPEGKITFQQNANDTETTNTYDEDALYRLANRYAENGLGGISPVLQDISYTYDAVGNITKVDDQSPMNNGKTVVYAYDDLSRLTLASTTFTANGQGYKEQYTYDAIGNILTKGSVHTAYLYQGTTTGNYANPHAATKIRTTAYTYDRNGNVLSVGGKATSTWDYNNRLIEMVQDATTTTYGYDHEGQRVIYTVNGNTTLYPNKFFNVETVGATTSTTTHIFLNDAMVATVEKKGATTTTYYHHTDHLSGASVTTSTEGVVAEITDYYPYGSIRYSYDGGAGFTEQRKFTGHELDTDTNLTYMGARYYAGNTGRFTSIDPVFSSVGNAGELKQKTGLELQQYLADPQGLNSYVYARNNPIKLVDENGEWFKEFATGQQSWSDFQGELGQAAQQMSNDSAMWNTVISHPYAAGAVVGVGAGAAAAGASAGLTALSLQYAGGLGTGCLALCGKAVDYTARYGQNMGAQMNQVRTTLNQLSNLKFDDHAIMRMVQRNVDPRTVTQIVNNTKPIEYFHDGAMKYGYYDSASKTFVAQIQSSQVIKTIITNVKPSYIKSLLNKTP